MSERSKNHTLKGGTSPCSLSMGVPLPGENGLDASKTSTIAKIQTFLFSYLFLRLLQQFLVKTEHEARARNVFELIFFYQPIKALSLGSFV